MIDDPMDSPELPPALGAVLESERGRLPFALIHGEALVACASWALGESGVTPVDLGTEWSGLADAEEPVVLHDSLCPMTPADFIADCLRQAARSDQVVVGVRPVTDTVKQVEAGLVGATVDRDSLAAIASPLVLPARVVAEVDALIDDLPSTQLPDLVEWLRSHSIEVRLVPAPAAARRVHDEADVRVLEAQTRPPGA